MAAKDIILKIIELDEKIAGLKNEFDALPQKDKEQALSIYFSGEIDKIKEDEEGTFDLQEGKKGTNAVNVKLA